MKNKIKKATLSTLSGAIIASNVPLNVFADVLEETNEFQVSQMEDIESLGTESTIINDGKLVEEGIKLTEGLKEELEEGKIIEEPTIESVLIEDEEKMTSVELETNNEPLEEHEVATEDQHTVEMTETITDNSETVEQNVVGQEVVDKTQVIVNIPDDVLESSLRKALGKAEGDITQADMERLTSFTATYVGIKDITGLEYAANLTNLVLYGNEISDLTPLSGLTKLTRVSLSSNQISDISALKGARSLRELYLSDNKISDESLNELIETLPQLIELEVSFDKELNLSTLTKLKYLDIVNSVINDFSELKINSPLERLGLISCEVMDWDSIKTLDSLEALGIKKMEVPDYEILKELPNLGFLYLFDNDILDLSQFNKMWQVITWFIYDQHAKLDVELVDNKIENPFIDLDGSYITTIDLPNGVTLSDDGAYLIFDNPLVGDSYELTARSYQTDQYNHYGEPVKLKATFTITASKKTGGELTVEENTLSNFDKELQIEIKDAVHEIEKIILPDGREVQGNTATYIVKESGDYTFRYVDAQGNEFTRTITVKVDKPVIDKPSTGDSDANKPNASVNQAPIITASNISIPVGYNLDLMSLATATDKEDGDLDAKIISSNFDNTKPGVYNVTYQATDSKGLSTTKTIHIVVRDLSEGENPDTKDIVIAPNEELDIESIVNEIAKDKGLTDVEILENNVNTSKPGDYSVVFEGTNAQKEQEIHSIKVTVMAEASSDKEDDSSSMNKPSGESVETGLTSGATITLGGLFTLAGIPFLKRKRK